jgi:hypothetical protein
MSKYHKNGYYRLLWNEYAKTIPFTWHRTERGADTIPKAYRWNGRTVSSDYYHLRLDGAAGLAKYAAEAGMRIDWQEGRLRYPKDLTHHLCPPDAYERALAEVYAEMDGKVKKLKVKDKRWKCPVCGEPWPLNPT